LKGVLTKLNLFTRKKVRKKSRDAILLLCYPYVAPKHCAEVTHTIARNTFYVYFSSCGLLWISFFNLEDFTGGFYKHGQINYILPKQNVAIKKIDL
jgi:hypothetical protein